MFRAGRIVYCRPIREGLAERSEGRAQSRIYSTGAGVGGTKGKGRGF
jgi:hypothetical protein